MPARRARSPRPCRPGWRCRRHDRELRLVGVVAQRLLVLVRVRRDAVDERREVLLVLPADEVAGVQVALQEHLARAGDRRAGGDRRVAGVGGGVDRGRAARLVELVVGDVAGAGGAARERRDLGRAQRAAVDVEVVDRAVEQRVAVLRAADPVLGRVAAGCDGWSVMFGVGADGVAVDVERAGRAADRDRDVRPLVEREQARCR